MPTAGPNGTTPWSPELLRQDAPSAWETVELLAPDVRDEVEERARQIVSGTGVAVDGPVGRDFAVVVAAHLADGYGDAEARDFAQRIAQDLSDAPPAATTPVTTSLSAVTPPPVTASPSAATLPPVTTSPSTATSPSAAIPPSAVTQSPVATAPVVTAPVVTPSLVDTAPVITPPSTATPSPGGTPSTSKDAGPQWTREGLVEAAAKAADRFESLEGWNPDVVISQAGWIVTSTHGPDALADEDLWSAATAVVADALTRGQDVTAALALSRDIAADLGTAAPSDNTAQLDDFLPVGAGQPTPTPTPPGLPNQGVAALRARTVPDP
ncbi:hypothetical protein AB0G02_39780, partial [Actinosynnema sp. NPDC023658]